MLDLICLLFVILWCLVISLNLDPLREIAEPLSLDGATILVGNIKTFYPVIILLSALAFLVSNLKLNAHVPLRAKSSDRKAVEFISVDKCVLLPEHVVYPDNNNSILYKL